APLTLATDFSAPGSLTITSTGLLDTTASLLTANGGALSLTAGKGLNVGATVALFGPTSFTTTGGDLSLGGAVGGGGPAVTLSARPGVRPHRCAGDGATGLPGRDPAGRRRDQRRDPHRLIVGRRDLRRWQQGRRPGSVRQCRQRRFRSRRHPVIRLGGDRAGR